MEMFIKHKSETDHIYIGSFLKILRKRKDEVELSEIYNDTSGYLSWVSTDYDDYVIPIKEKDKGFNTISMLDMKINQLGGYVGGVIPAQHIIATETAFKWLYLNEIRAVAHNFEFELLSGVLYYLRKG